LKGIAKHKVEEGFHVTGIYHQDENIFIGDELL